MMAGVEDDDNVTFAVLLYAYILYLFFKLFYFFYFLGIIT